LTTVKKEALQLYFPEFRPHIEKCRFQGCFHRAEPGCAVKDAVASGDVDKQRYGNYLSLLSEIEALPPEWARKSET
jgi:ribosome biogenesis GTPase